MGASLLLLLVFIFLWLQRVYKDEYKALEKEADLLFVNSVKGFENDLFKKMYTKARFIKSNQKSRRSERCAMVNVEFILAKTFTG